MSRMRENDPAPLKLMALALRNDTPSGYPFVLRYAFCRRKQPRKRFLNIMAVLHMLRQSSLITDDIFDCGECSRCCYV
jgi:hypothetical protein